MSDGKIKFSIDWDFTDYVQTWKEMEKLHKAGKARNIGVSNFSIAQMQKIIDNADIKPHNLQVRICLSPCNLQSECHAMNNEKETVDWCQKNGIAYTAWGPIGSPGAGAVLPNGDQLPKLLEQASVVEIAKKHGKTPAQVAIRWLIQRDIIVIPKSTNPQPIKENFEVEA